jgi:transcriptional regulator with XRE-family HTH domain
MGIFAPEALLEGPALASLRRQAGLSRLDLARQIGVSIWTVRRLERGHAVLEPVRRLAVAAIGHALESLPVEERVGTTDRQRESLERLYDRDPIVAEALIAGLRPARPSSRGSSTQGVKATNRQSPPPSGGERERKTA